MALDVDREKLLYAVGVLLGVAAVAYFGFQLFDQVSPVTTAALLFVGFLCFLVAGVGFEVERLDVVAYVLAAGCYLVFVAFVLSRFEVGDGGTFLLLAVSSALFIGLGYLAQTDRLAIPRRRAKLAIVVLLLAGVALIGVDLVGAQPTVSTDVADSVDVPDQGERVTVGAVTLRNDFLLPRRVDVPRYHACVYGPDFRPAPLEYERGGPDRRLPGRATERYDLVIPGRAFYTENGTLREGFRDLEAVPVETRETCPNHDEEPKVVVVRTPVPPYR